MCLPGARDSSKRVLWQPKPSRWPQAPALAPGTSIPSHTSPKQPVPSQCSKAMELRLISQASLARPRVCGFMVVQTAVSRWHSPSFTSGERGVGDHRWARTAHTFLVPTPASEISYKELGDR